MTRDLAPGGLEPVRALLNTRSIQNDRHRTPLDRLDELVRDVAAWESTVGTKQLPVLDDLGLLRQVRTDLRAALGRSHAPELADWVERLQIRPVPTAAGTGWPVSMAAAQNTAVTEVMCAALDAVNQGLWQRLRACPDCQYVFFDGSRNNTRTWCRMIREDPSGRSCGNLAKARAKRARDRAAAPESSM